MAFIKCRFCSAQFGPSKIREHEQTCSNREEKAEEAATPGAGTTAIVDRLRNEILQLKARVVQEGQQRRFAEDALLRLKAQHQDVAESGNGRHGACLLCALPVAEQQGLLQKVVESLDPGVRAELLLSVVVPALVKRLEAARS